MEVVSPFSEHVTHGDSLGYHPLSIREIPSVEYTYVILSCAFLILFPSDVRIHEFSFIEFHRVWPVGEGGFYRHEKVEFTACRFHPVTFNFFSPINSFPHTFSFLYSFLPFLHFLPPKQ